MPYKDIKDMTSDELLEFKAYIDSESAKVKDQLMVAKSTGAATGQYLPIPEYANLLSKKSYYAKKSQQIQTLMGRKKKLEKQERGIVGAELVIANLKAENARLRQNVDTVEQQSARIAELEARLAETQERNQNNIMNAESRMERLQAEIARLREGGCAREQGATQYCGEMQELVGRLTKLAAAWGYEREDEKWNMQKDTLRYCAERLMEAIAAHSGEANQ